MLSGRKPCDSIISTSSFAQSARFQYDAADAIGMHAASIAPQSSSANNRFFIAS